MRGVIKNEGNQGGNTMNENYNGYELNTVWEDESLGYGFRIHDKDGVEVSRNTEPYFAERIALLVARETVDELLAQDQTNTTEEK